MKVERLQKESDGHTNALNDAEGQPYRQTNLRRDGENYQYHGTSRDLYQRL